MLYLGKPLLSGAHLHRERLLTAGPSIIEGATGSDLPVLQLASDTLPYLPHLEWRLSLNLEIKPLHLTNSLVNIKHIFMATTHLTMHVYIT